jgi:hypothetical protein
MTVSAVNDAPTITGDLTALVAAGGAYRLTTGDLAVSDVDNAQSALTYTVSST